MLQFSLGCTSARLHVPARVLAALRPLQLPARVCSGGPVGRASMRVVTDGLWAGTPCACQHACSSNGAPACASTGSCGGGPLQACQWCGYAAGTLRCHFNCGSMLPCRWVASLGRGERLELGAGVHCVEYNCLSCRCQTLFGAAGLCSQSPESAHTPAAC